MDSTGVFVGVDVAKDELEVAVLPTNESFRYSNDAAGRRVLASRLGELKPERIVLEASGGYETKLVVALADKGLPVCVVNPRCVRDFAKAKGLLAKTDRLDAMVLADFARSVRPPLRELPDAETRELHSLLARRHQLVEMRTAEHQREAQAPPKVGRRIHAHVAWLDKEIEKIEDDLDNRIRKSPLYADADERYRTITGIGPQTALVLMLKLPELGKLDRKEIAALAGLAPFNRDSGLLKGKRSIWGGRASVRAALYMATLSAIRWNPPVRAFHEKLVARGKMNKVAITATMRKLLTALNAMARDHTTWDPSLFVPRGSSGELGKAL